MLNSLNTILSSDFERELLAEAENNLNSNSKIRFSNFAYVIRELIDICLKTQAPDGDVIRCGWYTEPNDADRKVLRSHRIKYMIQGGFENNLFDNILQIDFNERVSELNKYIRDTLSCHVHLNKECLNYSEDEINNKVTEFTNNINSFVDNINSIRMQIIEFLSDEIHSGVTDSFISQTLADLDELATHYYIENIYNVDIEVEKITSIEITGNITGDVELTLQYGSNRDLLEDMGEEFIDEYPFIIPFTINILPLNEFYIDVVQNETENVDIIDEEFLSEFRAIINENLILQEPSVDTSSFFE